MKDKSIEDRFKQHTYINNFIKSDLVFEVDTEFFCNLFVNFIKLLYDPATCLDLASLGRRIGSATATIELSADSDNSSCRVVIWEGLVSLIPTIGA